MQPEAEVRVLVADVGAAQRRVDPQQVDLSERERDAAPEDDLGVAGFEDPVVRLPAKGQALGSQVPLDVALRIVAPSGCAQRDCMNACCGVKLSMRVSTRS